MSRAVTTKVRTAIHATNKSRDWSVVLHVAVERKLVNVCGHNENAKFGLWSGFEYRNVDGKVSCLCEVVACCWSAESIV